MGHTPKQFLNEEKVIDSPWSFWGTWFPDNPNPLIIHNLGFGSHYSRYYSPHMPISYPHKMVGWTTSKCPSTLRTKGTSTWGHEPCKSCCIWPSGFWRKFHSLPGYGSKLISDQQQKRCFPFKIYGPFATHLLTTKCAGFSLLFWRHGCPRSILCSLIWAGSFECGCLQSGARSRLRRSFSNSYPCQNRPRTVSRRTPEQAPVP